MSFQNIKIFAIVRIIMDTFSKQNFYRKKEPNKMLFFKIINSLQKEKYEASQMYNS